MQFYKQELAKCEAMCVGLASGLGFLSKQIDESSVVFEQSSALAPQGGAGPSPSLSGTANVT